MAENNRANGSAIPPRLFKYEPATLQSLRNLKTQTIYFGSPKNFNDPYDCALAPPMKRPTHEQIDRFRALASRDPRLPKNGHDELARTSDNDVIEMMTRLGQNIAGTAIQDFLDTKGVTCFSETNESLLMWSHYASKGQGFCLEFDTAWPPFEKALAVDYQLELPALDLTEALLTEQCDEVVTRLYCTKSKHWEYEKEWRAIHHVAGTKFTYDVAALKALYFGTEAADDLIEIACLILQGQNRAVRLFRAHRDDSKFGLRFEEFTYTSYLDAMDATR